MGDRVDELADRVDELADKVDELADKVDKLADKVDKLERNIIPLWIKAFIRWLLLLAIFLLSFFFNFFYIVFYIVFYTVFFYIVLFFLAWWRLGRLFIPIMRGTGFLGTLAAAARAAEWNGEQLFQQLDEQMSSCKSNEICMEEQYSLWVEKLLAENAENVDK
jgi:X-X-X-Leu-X-X-Gly heptad repeat protein